MMNLLLHGSWAELSISGELNSGNAAEADARIADGLKSAVSLMLDFSALDYISSAGLRSILVAAQKVRDKQGKLAIAGAGEKIRRVFQLSGLLKHFHCFATKQEAEAFLLE